jgi:copper chaperone CopZ
MKKVFRLEGLDCANCASKIEKAISRLDGVRSASVSFLTTRLVIEADDDRMDVIAESSRDIVRRIGSGCVMK